jgi:HAD superfamily hydrolase (TIGR01509 family)
MMQVDARILPDGPYLGTLPTWRPEAVAFDLDGTLLDTERFCGAAKAAVLWAHGVTPDPDFIASMKGKHFSVVGGLLAEVLPESDPSTPAQLSAEFTGAFGGMIAASPVMTPGAEKLVEVASGSVPLAVATNNLPSIAAGALGQAGLLHRFDHVVTPEGRMEPKPAPDVYLRAAELCGAAPARTLAVEDSRTGLLAARRAGMWVLGVGPDPDPENAALADWWVPALDDPELLNWVSGWNETGR